LVAVIAAFTAFLDLVSANGRNAGLADHVADVPFFDATVGITAVAASRLGIAIFAFFLTRQDTVAALSGKTRLTWNWAAIAWLGFTGRAATIGSDGIAIITLFTNVYVDTSVTAVRGWLAIIVAGIARWRTSNGT
jgi:hypothetical protein